MKILKNHWFWVIIVAILIAIGSFACTSDLPETGRATILTDFAGPYYQTVNAYREDGMYFMPECHDYATGRTLVNVDITNIVVSFEPMAVKFPSCE